jgi:hypothetical protein
MSAVGRKIWAIAGGHIPLTSTGEEPRGTSRDELCILNAAARDARIELTVYFPDRDPAGPYRLVVKAQRVRHVRFNDLIDPQALPLDTPYACIVSADQPVVVQFTRVDTSQPANAVASTIAYAE